MKKKVIIFEVFFWSTALLVCLLITNAILFFRSNMGQHGRVCSAKIDKKAFSAVAECVIKEFDVLIIDKPEIEYAVFDFSRGWLYVVGRDDSHDVLADYSVETSFDYDYFIEMQKFFEHEYIHESMNVKATRHQVEFALGDYAIIYVRGLGIPQKFREEWSGFYFRPKGFSIKWFECCKWRK